MSTVEQVIARIAGAQHGIVTRAELLAAGISGKEIRHRIEIGLLVRVYNGVYSVGHRPLTWQSVYMAAVKAGGPGAVLCGLAAAYLLGILKAAVSPPPEVATGNQRRIPGLRARRLRLTLGDVTEYQGIPCTTVPCTIVHIAGLDEYDLARVCHEADIKFRGSVERVEAALERHPKAKGARKLRRIINGDSPVLLSILEKGFFDVLRDGGWPLPETNVKVGGRRVDCRWPGITIELNSYRYHRSRHKWERDYDGEREAHSRGDQYRRFTWKDVFEDQTYMRGELKKLLG